MLIRMTVSMVAVFVCTARLAAAGDWSPRVYDAAAAPADNPLKGFATYTGEYAGFPYSLEFDYVGLDDLMEGPASFTFDEGLEPLLEDIASRGNQAIVRVFLDYPDERSAIPQFLLDGGLGTTPYGDHGGGLSPDYDDAGLVAALEAFVAAFGARYDGDPRLGFVQIGLLGHWGEWHTHPNDGLFASIATQDRVLAAFDAAFDATRLLVSQDCLGRDPLPGVLGRDISFHDDDFANHTLPTGPDHFWSRMIANGLAESWRTRPIGGEVQPDFQEVIFNDPPGAPEDYNEAVDTTHASWLLNYAAFDNRWSAAERSRALAGAKRLGYEFHAAEVLAGAVDEGGAMTIGARIENRGVAPFYYPWAIHLALLDDAKGTARTWITEWDLRTILPGEGAVEFTYIADVSGLPPGTYEAVLRVPNPMPGGKPIRFANAEQGIEGLVLGAIALQGTEGEGEGEGEGCASGGPIRAIPNGGDLLVLGAAAVLLVTRLPPVNNAVLRNVRLACSRFAVNGSSRRRRY